MRAQRGSTWSNVTEGVTAGTGTKSRYLEFGAFPQCCSVAMTKKAWKTWLRGILHALTCRELSLKLADFMMPAQQLCGMTHHLISQGCRTGDGLDFAFLKTTKEGNLLWACQIFAHQESCCLRWKRVHSHWALTINLVRNKQQSFSQLHFSGLLTPCISKGHLKKSSLELLQPPLKDENETEHASVSTCREVAPYQIRFWEITLLIRMATCSGDLQ